MVKLFVQDHIAFLGLELGTFDFLQSSSMVMTCSHMQPKRTYWGWRARTATFHHALCGIGVNLELSGSLSLSFSFCFFSSCLVPILLLAYDTLFFRPQQNNSHQGNWWWGVWEKQELLHWDAGPPHGGYKCSERCSTLSSTLTVTVFSPSFLPLSNPFPSLPLAFYLPLSFLSCSVHFSFLCPNTCQHVTWYP